ncbi:MAG TPA: hypothetical protein PK698_02470 [Bacilli bacterium]|jgi:hypothetical protein|nr:hypothetical protein [Bacilli bacterium]
MRKVVILFAVIAIVAMSCGRVKKADAVPTEQDTTKVEIVDETTTAPEE